MSSPEGFTDHEILVEIREDLKQHMDDSHDYEVEVTESLAERPTRRELLGWGASIGAIVGIVVALLPL